MKKVVDTLSLSQFILMHIVSVISAILLVVYQTENYKLCSLIVNFSCCIERACTQYSGNVFPDFGESFFICTHVDVTNQFYVYLTHYLRMTSSISRGNYS